MAIIRDEIHEKDYLKVHNSTINSYDSLSIEAMGSLMYWLAKPPGWQPSVSELAKTWGFGREKAQRIMKELKEAGYVKKSQARSIKGQFVTTELHVLETPRKGSDLQVTLPDNVVAMGVVDNPAHGETRKSGNPSTGKPSTGKPSTEKQATINNRSLEITDSRNNSNTYVDHEVINAPPAIKVPYQKIVDAYHERLPELCQVRKLTDTRKRYIKNLWIGGSLDDMTNWENFFDYVSESDFLMGKTPGRNGGKPWQADLEWITKPANFVKILEGKYNG